MVKIPGRIRVFLSDENGQDLVEYSLLLAFIALAAVGLLSGVRTSTKGIWSAINSSLMSASTTAS